ncbi:MAG: hypothetical protein IPK83_10705 [Planctomycetes bacterium]|nr:hypothetical protein [Planctomycetota bacterium]
MPRPSRRAGDPALIDARSDVYSLGVILYEMLTGRAPYRVMGAMADALRAISEDEPVPPSSWHRGEERINVPSQFPALKVDDEVETIVLKALSKEKARRYQTAEELRRDIERYLEGDAIEAKRDSLGYVLRKKILKHRLSISIVTALAAISIGGAYGWDWGIFWKKGAESQQRRADQFEAKFALQERMLFIGGAAANVIPAPVAPGIVDRDATIRVNATPPVLSLNPLRTYSGELFVCDLLFESLFRRSRKSGLIPNEHLIDRLIDDSDARVKRVVLREGLKWHDGLPLTAADVVFSWRQTTSKSVGAGKASIALLLEKVEAVSDREVRFEFREPRGAWRAAMNFELVPRHLFEKEMDDDPSLRKNDYYKALHRKPVGCGPFRFVSWKNDLITLERWDEYERVEDRPLVRRVVISTIEKSGDQFAAAMAGKLDVCMLTQKQYREEIYQDEFLKVAREARHPFSWYSMILWNCTDNGGLFGDANVRRAMTYAININRIRAEVTNNLAAPCYGPWPVESPNFDPEVKRYAFNADIARDLLKEAGWQTNKSGQLEREKRNSEKDRAVTQPFEFELLVEGINATLVNAAENCRKDLAKVGVIAKIDVVSDSNEFLSRYYKGDFDACMTAISPSVDPEWDRVLYESGSSANRGSYSNKRIDELFDQGGKLLDENERAKCYQRIHRIIYEDQPCTFLFHEPALYAVSKRVEGIEFCDRTGPFLFYPGLRKWWAGAESGQ